MKVLLKMLIVVLITPFAIGQNNLDFESWNLNPQGIEEPEFWETNSVLNFICVSKSTNSSSGSYSALVKSNGISFEGKAPGILRTKWNWLTNPIQNISYNLKIDSLSSNAQAKVIITGYFNGNVQYSDTTVYSIETNGWINETLVLSDTSTICDSVWVSFIASTIATPTGYIGYSEFLIDKLLINNHLNTIQLDLLSRDIIIYPNPVKHILRMEVSNEINIIQIELYTLEGKKVKNFEKTERELNILGLDPGYYYLKISTKQGDVSKNLLIE
jgi:hypothetical protein